MTARRSKQDTVSASCIYPPQFNSKNSADAADLMRAHPLASLISIDDTGLPFVSHIPLHLEQRPATGAAPENADEHTPYASNKSVSRPVRSNRTISPAIL